MQINHFVAHLTSNTFSLFKILYHNFFIEKQQNGRKMQGFEILCF